MATLRENAALRDIVAYVQEYIDPDALISADDDPTEDYDSLVQCYSLEGEDLGISEDQLARYIAYLADSAADVPHRHVGYGMRPDL